jgi:hypothetical protein
MSIEIKRDGFPMVRSRFGVTEWVKMAKCQRSYFSDLVFPSAPEEISFQSEVSSSAAIGTLIHRSIEADGKDLEARRRLTDAGVELAEIENILKWVKSAIPSAGVNEWRELGFEVPFLEIQDGHERMGVVVGAIDRVVQVGSKTGFEYHIYDYKNQSRTLSDSELFERYRAQLELYAWALGKMEPDAIGKIRVFLVLIQKNYNRVLEVDVDLKNPDFIPARYFRIANHILDRIELRGGSSEDNLRLAAEISAKSGQQCQRCKIKRSCRDAQRDGFSN